MILFEKKNKYGSFNDLMDVSIETGDKWLDKKLNTNICYGKGGGGSAPQDVPKTLRPYVKQVLDRAKGLYGSYLPQELYQGERIVGFTPQEQAAQEGVADMVGRGISADRTLTSGATYYQPALDLLGESGNLGARAVQDITAEEIMGRMSPYQQAVTDIAKRKATQEGQMYMNELSGQAARTGGFGGSRQAILEGQAMGDLGQRLTDIQTTGSQSAYQDAVRAAEAQRARLAGGAQQAGALSQAFGALGQQALGQGYREQGYLAGLGEQERGLQQQRADLAYQQFVEQRDYPDVQLQKFSSLIQGFPFQFSQAPQQPSAFQQAVGGAAAIGGLGRGLDFFNKGGKIDGNRKGGLSTIYAATAGQIRDLIDKKKEIEDEINRRNAARKSPSAQYSLQREIDAIDKQLASFSQNVPTKPAQKLRGRPSPVRNASSQQQVLRPAPLQNQPASSSQQPASTQDNPASQAAQDLVQTVSGSAYPATLADIQQKLGGVPITELQTRAMKSYGALEALLDKDKFDAESRRKEIEEQIASERSQGGFDLAALGVEIMSKPLDKIDTDLIRNLGTSKKEVGKLKSMLEKLPAEERAYALKNELTKLTSLGTIQDLIPDSLEAPSATPAVIQNAVELASQGMGKSFSQNQLEKAGIKIGELALEVQSDIDTLQIKDDNARDLAFQRALADRIRDEIQGKNIDAGSIPDTGGDKANQGNQGRFIPPPNPKRY
jgi:hypothetical protein